MLDPADFDIADELNDSYDSNICDSMLQIIVEMEVHIILVLNIFLFIAFLLR